MWIRRAAVNEREHVSAPSAADRVGGGVCRGAANGALRGGLIVRARAVRRSGLIAMMKTTPTDKRFPTQNQGNHCW